MDLTNDQKRQGFREDLQSIMHDGRGRAGHAFNFILIILILLSVAVLPVTYLPGSSAFSDVIGILEAVIIGIFTMEYVLRVYAAPKRLHYIVSFYGLIDLIAILPFYLSPLHTEWLLLLRFLRFLKLSQMQAAAGADEIEEMKEGIGLAAGEQVEYVVTRHPLFLIVGCIPPLLAISFAICLLSLIVHH